MTTDWHGITWKQTSFGRAGSMWECPQLQAVIFEFPPAKEPGYQERRYHAGVNLNDERFPRISQWFFAKTHRVKLYDVQRWCLLVRYQHAMLRHLERVGECQQALLNELDNRAKEK